MRLPTGAHNIYQARLVGKKPSELVLISVVGVLPRETNPVVIFDCEEDPRTYDWRWAVGLSAALVFDERSKLTARVITDRILNNQSSLGRELYLWRADKQKGWVAMGTEAGVRLFSCTVSEQIEFRGLGCC